MRQRILNLLRQQVPHVSLYALLVLSFMLPVTATSAPQAPPPSCQRIVSFAPSVTELVYALGLEARLVGVTRYCRYPKEASEKTKVGGFYDINVEQVIGLRPTALIHLAEHETARSLASQVSASSVVLEHRSLEGIVESALILGRACGIESRAEKLVGRWRAEIEAIRKRAIGRQERSVLVAVGRGDLGPAHRSVYFSGNDGFYSNLLEVLGVRNALSGATVAGAQLSPEMLLTLKPDKIIEVVPQAVEEGWAERQLLQSWALLPGFSEEPNFVNFITQPAAVVPGPRFLEVLQAFEDAINK